MNKLNKFVTIILALVFSAFTNVKADDDYFVAKYTEPTGGKAELRASKDKGFRFLLLNGTTPGEWKVKMVGDDVTFLEGPFKGQTYKAKKNDKGQAQLHEQEGRKTVWTHE
jgi:hypothetical protein